MEYGYQWAIESWGDVLISFGGGSYDTEGNNWYHSSMLMGGDTLWDTTYYSNIDDLGIYIITGDTLTTEIVWSNDPNRIGEFELVTYDVEEDTLKYFHTFNDSSLYTPGTSIFHRL